jgi:hypothetical protein
MVTKNGIIKRTQMAPSGISKGEADSHRLDDDDERPGSA